MSAPPPERVLLDEISLPTAEATRRLGRQLGRRLRSGDVVVLVGDLGAGKTTFTQGLGEGLEVRGPVTSPTFVISRIHPSLVGGPALVHVDAYRLGDAAELDDLDLDATVEDSVTVVEWGEDRAEQLADSRLLVDISRSGEPVTTDEGAWDTPDPRTVVIRALGPRWTDEPPLTL